MEMVHLHATHRSLLVWATQRHSDLIAAGAAEPVASAKPVSVVKNLRLARSRVYSESMHLDGTFLVHTCWMSGSPEASGLSGT
eukprot:5896471-Prymnesium_polylepis.1